MKSVILKSVLEFFELAFLCIFHCALTMRMHFQMTNFILCMPVLKFSFPTQVGTCWWNFAVRTSIWLLVHSNCTDLLYLPCSHFILVFGCTLLHTLLTNWWFSCIFSYRGGQLYQENLLPLMILKLTTGFPALLCFMAHVYSSICCLQVIDFCF